MTKPPLKNIAVSVHQRLLNLSRERKEDFNHILTKYTLERFLYRLSSSEFSNSFLLKGAMLFEIWFNKPYRPTKDIDVLGFIANDIADIEKVFKLLCNLVVEDDGLIFLANTVKGQEIREAKKYQGIRITLTAKLGKATIPTQIDIGFGDAVTPAAELTEFPTLLDFPAPILRVYPKYTVVAEKFEAMTSLGITNSRMKDFYDIWILMQTLDFQGSILSQALKATFEQRKTKLPNSKAPLALTSAFAEDYSKQKQWQGFIKKNRLEAHESLAEIIIQLREFLMPPTFAAAEEREFLQIWQLAGPWQSD